MSCDSISSITVAAQQFAADSLNFQISSVWEFLLFFFLIIYDIENYFKHGNHSVPERNIIFFIILGFMFRKSEWVNAIIWSTLLEHSIIIVFLQNWYLINAYDWCCHHKSRYSRFVTDRPQSQTLSFFIFSKIDSFSKSLSHTHNHQKSAHSSITTFTTGKNYDRNIITFHAFVASFSAYILNVYLF